MGIKKIISLQQSDFFIKKTIGNSTSIASVAQSVELFAVCCLCNNQPV